MREISGQNKIIKYWFGFFVAHLVFLLFAVWNVYFVRRLVPESPSVFVTNDSVYFSILVFSLVLFAASFLLKKNLKSFIFAQILCGLISLLGLVILFSIDSFYFLLWFIIGIFGSGIQLLRYHKFLEKN